MKRQHAGQRKREEEDAKKIPKEGRYRN